MDFSFLDKISFIKLEFLLKPINQITLSSFKGSTIRGGFGYSFKKSICTQKIKECERCLIFENCLYIKLFEPKIFDIGKRKEIPRPFVIEYPSDKKTIYKENEKLKFNLILFGNSINFFPYFFISFLNLGNEGIGKEREKFIIDEISQIYPVVKKIFKFTSEKIEIPEIKKVEYKKGNLGKIKLKFITPAKIKHYGKLISIPEFHMLIKAILRRTYLILKYWCDFDGKIDFNEIIERSKEIKISKCDLRWYDYERYSTRQKERLKHGGIIGEIEYKGEIGDFLPLLEVGSHIHIGKNTSFGLGHYIIL
ncbi:MAG: CRISPR system precrRNA processing endoribonuclease RAMP protein Cas6 [Candidatus Ratteibacteria bacterium]